MTDVAESRSEWTRRRGDTELPIDQSLIEACAPIALKLGGPRLSRLGVTSALRGEGRTTVALAMAALYTRDFGRRTLVVDCDLENPYLSELFAPEGQVGLAEVVTGRLSLDQALLEVGEGMWVLPAGRDRGDRARLVRELLASNLFDELFGLFDISVVDLPPLLESTAGQLLASTFESALVVVRAQATPLAKIKAAVDSLPTPPFLLVNGTHSSSPRWLRRLMREE